MLGYGICGFDCDKCGCAASGSCSGCRQSGGKTPFGSCKFNPCCVKKGLKSCSGCAEFPCETLYGALEGANALYALDNLRKSR